MPKQVTNVAADDALTQIYRLANDEGEEVIAARLAERLELKPASMAGMLARLKRDKLVKVDPKKSLGFKLFEYQRAISNSRGLFTREIDVTEMKTASEAYEMGREVIDNPLNQMWSTAIFEIQPNNNGSADVVWEWHLWDHLVQNYCSACPNYAVISNHPELFNINCGVVGNDLGGPEQPNADWMHINAVHYNSDLDQIIIWNGIPIRSLSENLVPAPISLSSYNVSML